jgi:hypothetical protein
MNQETYRVTCNAQRQTFHVTSSVNRKGFVPVLLGLFASSVGKIRQSSVPPFGCFVAQKHNIVLDIRLDASLVGLVGRHKAFEFLTGNWFGKVIAIAICVTTLKKTKSKKYISVSVV